MNAAHWFAKMREVLAGPGQSAEWVAFSTWWRMQKKHQRYAWYVLAGLPSNMPTAIEWGDIPEKYRAALVVAISEARRNLAGIASAMETAAPPALSYLRKIAA